MAKGDHSAFIAYPSSLGGEDTPGAEAQVRRFWQEHDVFHRSERGRRGRPDFVFYEGPPTANGRPGVHHAISRVIKDIFCRYQTMTGHHVLRKAGWDTHGLPVEIEVEKQLGLASKEEVERFGVEEFNSRCRESVFTYKKEWDEFTHGIGFWLDLDHPYVTYENDYIESVWWLLKTMWDKGLLYRGYKVVPYCARCETALSSHEVAQGYREVDDPSVTVRMKVKGKEAHSFLVWTTTPWTLPANVALAVGDDIDYVAVRHEDEVLILAEARLSAYFGDEVPEIVERMKGRELVGWEYEQLIPILKTDKPGFRVVTADFVSTEDGTGIVHIAPAYGEDDYRVGQEHDLPLLHPVDKAGRFVDELTPYAGLFVKDADKRIIADLKSDGRLFAQQQVHHSYPHCWRCNTPLLYYARDSWYIRTTAVKDELIAANDDVNWVPTGVGRERFGDWLENNVDWAISRDRFWGTPLPVWECACGERLCIGSRKEIEEAGGVVPDDLHRPYIDEVELECPKCGGAMHRTPEVIDVWFDSGAMPFAQWHYPFENREQFDRQFPADFISEGVDQTRGWFYSLLAIATMVAGRSSYRNVLTLGLVLDKNGQKMSKTRGNAVDPMEILRNDGADPLRWYLVTVSPAYAPIRFDIEGVRESRRKVLGTLENVFAFFSLYANLEHYTARRVEDPARLSQQLDRWILSRYHAVVEEVAASLDGWDATRAGRVLGDFIVDELSNWYVRRSRRRFWKAAMGEDKRAAFDTLYTVLEGVSRLLAPFTPFIAERLYRGLHPDLPEEAPAPTEDGSMSSSADPAAGGGEPADSVHLADWPGSSAAARDRELEESMAAVLQVVGLGRSLRNAHELRVRQPLREGLVYGRSPALRRAVEQERYAALIADELNLKRVSWLDDPSRVARVSAKANFRKLGARFGKKTPAVAKAIAALDGDSLARLREDGSLTLSVDGDEVEITGEDVFISEEGLEGYVTESQRDCMVALSIELDEELRREGLARELVNRIQNLRKQAGLAVSDRISLYIGGDEAVAAAWAAHQDHIREETLVQIHAERPAPDMVQEEFSIDGHKALIALAPTGVGSPRS